MNWFIGPWIWDNDEFGYWRSPSYSAAIDLRTEGQSGVRRNVSGYGLFCGPKPNELENKSDYTYLGSGNWHDVKLNDKDKAALAKAFPTGKAPESNDLIGAIRELFTECSDPKGLDCVKPIIPTHDGRLDLRINGLTHTERFKWGKGSGAYQNRLRSLLKDDFSETAKCCLEGKLGNPQQHRKVLDGLCDKYGVDDWREFVPLDLIKDIPGRLKHETTFTDDFNRADSTGLGANWTNVVGNGFDIVSNQARGASGTGGGTIARYNSALSSVDHSTQCDATYYPNASSSFGVHVRLNTSAFTSYSWVLRATTTPRRRTFRNVSGVGTVLNSDDNTIPAVIFSMKISISGSSIKVYINGTEISALAATDVQITSNLNAGMQGWQASVTTDRTIQDNFLTEDAITGPSIIYTNLERDYRGMMRGTYFRG